MCYYLAQVAAQIEKFMEGFKKDPAEVSIEDFMLEDRFLKATPEGEEETQDYIHAPVKNPNRGTRGRKPIEPGPEAMNDPKWAAVNENAKAIWARRLGMTMEELEAKRVKKNGRAGT